MKTGVRHVKTWAMVLSVFALVAALCVVWKSYSSSPAGPLEAQYVSDFTPDLSKVEAGMVSLWAGRDDAQGSHISLIGCGLVIDQRGYVLTSVKLGPDIRSLYVLDRNGLKYAAEIVIYKEKARLALLKVYHGKNGGEGFEAAVLGDSEQVGRGDRVTVLGARRNPGDWDLTTITGRITDDRQTLVVEKRKYRDLIETDVLLTAENAGGPLVNEDGEVIGLALPTVQPPACPDLSYAVPINHAKTFLAGLPIPWPSDGPGGQVRTWLGVETIPLNPVIATHMSAGRSRGELVNHIGNNTPVESAGLRRGDVILSINDTRIADRASFDAIAPQLCQESPLELTVLRDGQEKVMSVSWDNGVYVRPAGGSLAEVVLVLLIFALMYFFVYKNVFDRVVLFVLGAIVVAITGHYLGFYDQDQMAAALLSKIDVLCFIVGMHLVCGVLEEAGTIEYLAKKITLTTKGNAWRIMALFCIITYALSLVVNNLTTIMLMAPMVLRLSKYLDCDPKPFLTSMIVASNLGGASTMVGDFPNMLIGAEIGLPFKDFLRFMLPICLLQLVVLLVYLRLSQAGFFKSVKGKNSPQKAQRKSVQASSQSDEYLDCQSWLTDYPELEDGNIAARGDGSFFENIKQGLSETITNPKAMKRGLAILAAVTVGFFLSDWLNCSPAIIALVGGIVALVFGACNPVSLMQKVGIKDILFFSGLFVLVGAAEAAGALDYVTQSVVQLSFGNVLILTLILMWTAAFGTCFLNAGPATALFLPVVLAFKSAAPHHLYWWALSLGVCAGSSGTLSGATAGSVTASMLDRFMKKEDAEQDNGKPTSKYGKLTFQEFAKIGLPIMFIFLLISSIYIAAIYYW